MGRLNSRFNLLLLEDGEALLEVRPAIAGWNRAGARRPGRRGVAPSPHPRPRLTAKPRRTPTRTPAQEYTAVCYVWTPKKEEAGGYT
jgi:hypothetical protein